MAYKFESLPQLVDHRKSIPKDGNYSKRVMKIKTRVWHHSLTKKTLSGSIASAFANYHISLGWPGVGYSLIIEPKNIVNTPKGKRARIIYANDINRRTYHVGDSNQFSLGICVAGDYRYEKLDDPTKASIDELQEALVNDNIGNEDKSHQEMPGYGWKPCCVFNYSKVFKFLDSNVTQAPLPNTYTIQQGDTFWGIANGIDGLTVEKLIKANPGVDPKSLKVDQKINLGNARPNSKPKANLEVDGYPGPLTIAALQRYFGTSVDSKISKPSLVVKALQRWLGVKADGYPGPITISALQRRLGTPVDGVISSPSLVIKELQRRLNRGKL